MLLSNGHFAFPTIVRKIQPLYHCPWIEKTVVILAILTLTWSIHLVQLGSRLVVSVNLHHCDDECT